LVRPDLVELLTEDVELALLCSAVARRRLERLVLERLVHPLVAPVLLRLARLGQHRQHAQLEPPYRQLAEPPQRGRRERHAIVGLDAAWQSVLFEQPRE